MLESKTSLPILFKDFSYLFLERGEGREKERERNIMRGRLSCGPHWGPGLQPRHVPWLRIEPVTLLFAHWPSIHWATPARAPYCFNPWTLHELFSATKMCSELYRFSWEGERGQSCHVAQLPGVEVAGRHGAKPAPPVVASRCLGWSEVLVSLQLW